MLIIQPFQQHNFEQVQAIYLQGLSTGNASFQTETKTWQQWQTSMLASCRLVGMINDEVVGWAALSATSSRAVYAGVAEVSIYISQQHSNQGIGGQLLTALINESELQGIWTLQAGIFPENIASINLHKKHGFREIGYREKIAQLNGVWRDTILLEKRSTLVGVNI